MLINGSYALTAEDGIAEPTQTWQEQSPFEGQSKMKGELSISYNNKQNINTPLCPGKVINLYNNR